MSNSGGAALLFVASRRPAPIVQPSFLPFDQSDPGGGGDVHTVLPPEQIIPKGYDIDWWRGDAWGVTLTETPPLVPGCNTTPQTMVMSYLMPWYWQNYNGSRAFVDKILTAHARRNYSHFHLDRPTWLAAGMSDIQAVEMMAYIQSWGFFTSFWFCGTTHPYPNWDVYGPDAVPLAQRIEARGLASKTVWVVGEELNSYVIYGEDGLDNIVRQLGARQSFKVALHFTSNYPGCYGGDVPDEQTWYAKLAGLGLWGTLWQADPSDTAGAQTAHLYDTRWRMGKGNRNLKCVAFELIGNGQLYGQYDEAAGRRRGWENICATQGPYATDTPPVAGAGNGLSNPDGSPL